MQRPLRIAQESSSIPELVLMLCLVVGTWYLAELSNGILDVYAKVSLIPAVGVVACAIKLWSNLQHERDLRRQAEQLLRAARPLPMSEAAGAAAALAPVDMQPVLTLSYREREVLALIASSCTNQRIADALNISLNTVERHSGNVYRKLGVRGRVEATHYAVRYGLVTEEAMARCRESGDGS